MRYYRINKRKKIKKVINLCCLYDCDMALLTNRWTFLKVAKILCHHYSVEIYDSDDSNIVS